MSDTEGERPAQGPPQSEAHLLKHGENQHEADSEEAGDRDEEAGDVNMEPVDDIGLATGDIDLDQVNDNLQDFGDDNLSLEVQLGDGSSCHASDVSSLSFQNIVLEDADTENLEDDNLEIHTSRRDSEESSDSYQNEITEADAESFSGALEEEIKRKNSKQGRKPSARSEEGNYEDDVDLGDDLFEDTGTLKRKSNLSLTASDQGQSDNQGAETDNTQTTENVTSDSSPSHMDTGSSQDALPEESSNEHAQSEGEAVSAAVGASDGNAANADNIDCPINNAYSRNSMDGTTQPHIQIHKRNSLEIRNNIPNVNEVKNYNSDNVDLSKYHNSGAVPKMKKKSPGLARRLNEEGPDNSDRDTSSSEKESEQTCIDTTVTSAQELFNARLKNGNLASFAGFKSTRAIQQQQTNGNEEGSEPPSVASSVNSDEPPKKGVDVENEYDYVKYARIQKGDSYVGMRLAYSSSNDSLNLKRNSWGGRVSSDDDHYPGSSRENSPEKIIQQQQRNAINEHIKASKVNEDTLTEIPLNGSDNAQSEDQRNFSLSPEATECDSAEVESVLSDEGKSSTSGMPAVEDGLSSSQGSDAEDLAMHESQRPAEILKRRHKAEVDHELSSGDQRHLINLNEDHNPEDRSPSTESSPTERTKRSRDDLDLAIKDIKTAIRQSKSITLKSPYQDEDGKEQEPIWVMRDSYVRKLQRQEEMRRVREEIERQQEEDLIKREQEQVYQVEDDDEKLLKYQYSKNDGKTYASPKDYDTDEETDKLLTKPYNHDEKVDIPELSRPPVNRSAQAEKRRSRAREVTLQHPDDGTVLIEGVLFRARYLGSTQLISEGQPSKAMRMMQAQEAVGRIKAPEGESQPSTEVDLFVSTEKIMVLNTDLQEIMMDHSLRTISYIADIGDIVVIMARRRCMTSPGDESLRRKKQSKILCHVFESEEAQLIAQSIGQAFQVAYMEFLKANGIEDPGMMKEMDYQEVLNQQEIYGEELFLFANKDMQKEVIVPKLKGEPLGVVIVESGWGSMVPTVVLANMCPTGAAARCGQLNIGDQIISINGISLVGLPLSSCQTYIKAAKNQTVVKITSVPCPPVVEVLIKRPDVKYQLGFSVQNGVICSLLRGGIAERGGVRVGHRIIEINTQSVVAVPHEKIVSMLANSVGEITMKTMPTSIFRLLTGQEVPHYI